MSEGGFVLRLFRPPTAANARTNKSTNHEQLALETAECKPDGCSQLYSVQTADSRTLLFSIGDSFLSALTAAQYHAQ